jgi:lysophospholipase L1-like esterase
VFLLTACGGSGPTGPSFDFSGRVIVAFGNSITLGVGDTLQTGPRGYPFRLEQLLKAEFPAAIVINRGVAGERTFQGVRRLPSILNRDAPDFVLILEGVNDIENASSSWAGQIIANLEGMVLATKASESIPLLATLLPTFGSRAFKNDTIILVNELIRALAARESIPLVDLHAVFTEQEDPSSLFDADGLHPNGEGYDLVADTFYRALLRAAP